MSVSMSKPETARPAEPGDRNGTIPPLESGDRLTRDEFERRYAGCRPSRKPNSLKESSTWLHRCGSDTMANSITTF